QEAVAAACRCSALPQRPSTVPRPPGTPPSQSDSPPGLAAQVAAEEGQTRAQGGRTKEPVRGGQEMDMRGGRLRTRDDVRTAASDVFMIGCLLPREARPRQQEWYFNPMRTSVP
ncbi:hypothetical protein Vafri_6120, partial [Volvox africanus]